jgi:FKBP-type peptidyl-prolyl cis-trans isomerase
MKYNPFLLFSTFLFVLVMTACNKDTVTDTDTNADLIIKWKLFNDSSFVSMKDSVTYTRYNIPTVRGGGSFYFKISTPGDSTSTSPLIGDTIVANYRGSLVNGYIFDQSFKGANPQKDSTATPIRIATNNLISGWKENLIQMKVGERRTIILPQELGYGAYFNGPIPPYSTLIFDMQLVSVKKKVN